MLSAFTNIFKIPELKQRILFTLAIIVVVRIGASITMPGVNAALLKDIFDSTLDPSQGGGVAALFNIFSGGALHQCAIFSLGIMPYISASIMMQLMTAVIPKLNKMQREDGGRQKISQYTRYMAVALCLFQGYLLAISLENPQSNFLLKPIADVVMAKGTPLVLDPGWDFRLTTMLTTTAGTLFLMWLGDQVTDRGIGNGISMVITINIVSSLPAALAQAWNTFVPQGGQSSRISPIVLVVLIAFLIIVVAAVICVTQAQRKIAIQYAKRQVGRKVYGGQTQHMPLKLNYAGVMPIIFAQAILLFPATMLSMIFPGQQWAGNLANALSTGWLHYTLYGLMIFFFSYFWVATQFQPTQIAEDLKRNGGYIPGVRPGKPTAEFLDFTMTRLTFAGAIFLTIVAVMPEMLSRQLNVPPMTAHFFGGTSLLILVGVLLDTMRQMETFLLQQHYDGFLRKGKIRGRSTAAIGARSRAADDTTIIWLYAGIGAILILFAVILILK